ncbi:MAG: endonuclease Q family protein [candidate division WOR-3 bacterium]|nr:endonuclease Q family protein [candidate division WOR-3 bacterium]MCX7836942.1 endonuclease Q family protein [candidate division WOR-3 bacterium]MDW8114143.1 endonuclease Q family protein [candidate division WOR-3 bacterium]
MIIADLHIHSLYSRATSRDMEINKLVEYAKYKGIKILGTGDFTHPEWLKELKRELKEIEEIGLCEKEGIYFILQTEVSNIYQQDGKLRRIHNLIYTSSFERVEKINKFLFKYGDLASDGRPTLNLSSYDMVNFLKDIDEDCFIVPAHIWTPHFSLFGSVAGFDSVEECFLDLTNEIFALETGLSSDPKMNWRLSSLDNFTLISNSDAHSPQKIGREANVFRLENISYYEIKEILKNKNKEKFLFTIEFFPEEGKYHYDGHRNCNVRLSPKESIMNNDLCPICGKKVTIGVLHRVELLADREEGYFPNNAIPFKNLIPLDEIIAEVLNVNKESMVVKNLYLEMVKKIAPEFEILLNVPIEELQKNYPKIAEGIEKMRKGDIKILPGYDGVFGEIRILERKEEKKERQKTLF